MTDITTYIPQRAPFVMVDDIIEVNDAHTVTRFTIRDENLFVKNGRFVEPGLVENMAQTVAAGEGYKAKQEGREVSVGYIGALKNVIINQLPIVGQTITTEITFLHHIANVHVVHGRVSINDAEFASCEMKVFIQPS